MTEKEKMLRHVLYDANNDPQLLAERANAKELCYDFNQLRPKQTEEQTAIMRRLLGRMGDNCQIVAPFWCDYGYRIAVGNPCRVLRAITDEDREQAFVYESGRI